MIPADVDGLDLDRAVRSELVTLSKENARGVGEHLIMVARLLDEDIDLARAHADAAVRRAGRVPSVREARGMVAYHEGDWHLALTEFRTARRLSGSGHLLPYLVDCERALGRVEKALDLAHSPEANALPMAERAEIAIIVSGIRRDAGQPQAALEILEGPHLKPGRTDSWAPRMYYAYADALLDLDRRDEARAWFQAAADVDTDLQTDAWERLDELDGTVLVGFDDDEDVAPDEVDSQPDRSFEDDAADVERDDRRHTSVAGGAAPGHDRSRDDVADRRGSGESADDRDGRTRTERPADAATSTVTGADRASAAPIGEKGDAADSEQDGAAAPAATAESSAETGAVNADQAVDTGASADAERTQATGEARSSHPVAEAETEAAASRGVAPDEAAVQSAAETTSPRPAEVDTANEAGGDAAETSTGSEGRTATSNDPFGVSFSDHGDDTAKGQERP